MIKTETLNKIQAQIQKDFETSQQLATENFELATKNIQLLMGIKTFEDFTKVSTEIQDSVAKQSKKAYDAIQKSLPEYAKLKV